MTTNRIVLLIDDWEIKALDETLASLDTQADIYRDDWEEDEEPLAALILLSGTLDRLTKRIKSEVKRIKSEAKS